MKQVLRDLKIHAFINLLPKIIVLGGMGAPGFLQERNIRYFMLWLPGCCFWRYGLRPVHCPAFS